MNFSNDARERTIEMILGEARNDPVDMEVIIDDEEGGSWQGGDGGAYSDDGVEGDNEV
jgi:hypothetical protein